MNLTDIRGRGAVARTHTHALGSLTKTTTSTTTTIIVQIGWRHAKPFSGRSASGSAAWSTGLPKYGDVYT